MRTIRSLLFIASLVVMSAIMIEPPRAVNLYLWPIIAREIQKRANVLWPKTQCWEGECWKK